MIDETDIQIKEAQQIIDIFAKNFSNKNYSVTVITYALTKLFVSVLQQSKNPEKVITLFLHHVLNILYDKEIKELNNDN